MLSPTNIFCCANVVEFDNSLSVWAGGLPDTILFDVATGEMRNIQSRHMPLGVLAGAEFDAALQVFDTIADERLCMLTDGMIEARNAEGEAYGMGRLEAIIKNDETVFEGIIEDLQQFAQMDQHDDDTTLLEIKCSDVN